MTSHTRKASAVASNGTTTSKSAALGALRRDAFSSGGAACTDIFLSKNQFSNPPGGVVKFGIALDMKAAWPWRLHVNDLGDAARTRRHHHNAVGEYHGLGN